MFSELRRGVIMKFAGLAAKATFILVFARALDPGEFSKYFLGFSTALIASRILSMGADDELAYRVGGRRTAASRYLGISRCFSAIGIGLVSAALFIAAELSFYVLCSGVSFLLAGSSFATGTLRSLDNFYQEARANLPWVFVCLFATVVSFKTANQVILGISLAYLLILALELGSLRKRKVRMSRRFVPALIYYIGKYRSWIPKALSTAAIASSLRAFPLWLGFLQLGATDQLAYAFAIGEVAFQLAMTYVNLLLSSRALRESSTARFPVTVFVFTAIAGVVSVILYYFLRYGIGGHVEVDLSVLFFSSVYSVSIALFSFVRVKIWSRTNAATGRGGVIILAGQFLMFLFPGLVLTFFGYKVSYILISAVFNGSIVAILNVLNSRAQSS